MRLRMRWKGGSTLYALILGRTTVLQIAIIAFGLLVPILTVLPLRVQERLIDQAVPAKDGQMILVLAAQYAAAVLGLGAGKFLVTYFRAWVQEIVVRVLRTAIVEAQRKRPPDVASRKLGAAISIMTGEVDDLGAFAAEALNTPLIEGGTLVSLFGFALFAEPRLAAIGAAALALQTLFTPFLQNRINRLTRKRIKSLRRAGLDLIDATMPAHPSGRLAAALGEIRQTYHFQLRMNGLKAATKVLNNLIMHMARISILGYGGWLVIEGEIGIGLVVAFLSGLAQIDEHWGELLDFYRRWTNARVKFRLVADIMNDTNVPEART